MGNKYFNIGIYDNLFLDRIIERRIEIYLSDSFSNLNQNNNKYYCNIQGKELYDISVKFKSNDEIEEITCACPFAKEGNKCKHMYALLLKIKCNYNLKTIKKDIKKELKEIRQIFKDFKNDYIVFKNNRSNYLNDIEKLKEKMNYFKIMYNNILENIKNKKSDVLILKDILNLKSILYEQITNFNERISIKEKTNSTPQKNQKEKSFSLFGLFINALDNINKEEQERNKYYDEEQQKYRRTIIEKNIYEGKSNEEIYDGLDEL